MAYIATDPKTNYCYAICSANPDFIHEAVKDIKKWKADGSVVELLPLAEAQDRFASSIIDDEIAKENRSLKGNYENL